MQHDGANFALATITGGWAWLTAETLAIIVPCLWAFYVLMLIAKTLPEVLEKHPWVGRFWARVWGAICALGRWVRGLRRGGGV